MPADIAPSQSDVRLQTPVAPSVNAALESAVIRPATLEDVASRVGVSMMTVSNVLNGKRRNSPYREAILQAVKDLNFVPNPHAQRLCTGRSNNTIGLFSLDLDLGIGTTTIKTIQKLLTQKGFSVPVHSFGSYEGGEALEQAALMAALCSQVPRAIVCNPKHLANDAVDELKRYQAAGGIVVCYCWGEKAPLECDQVIFDEEDNTYQGARYLLQQGHTRIGFCHHSLNLQKSRRLAGFKRALQEFGADYNPEWVIYGGPGQHLTYEEGGCVMARAVSRFTQRPTALCIVNDLVASTFINEIQKHGVRIPQELSVVGHDDLPMAKYCAVPLTTTSHPVEKISATVVDLLTARIEGRRGAFDSVTVQGELVVRESTASPAT